MIICHHEQGTEEWFQARCGIPSASNFDKIVTASGDSSKQREKYLNRLAGEKVSGKSVDGFKSAAMERGVELEAEARSYYEIVTGRDVQRVGFCYHDDGEVGCSPDGLIGEDGGLEIKCPEIHTHVEYYRLKKLPTTYYQQVQGSLWVTGRDWWDFLSYFPGLKPLIIRVTPDKDFQEKLEAELEKFCDELKQVIEEIR